MNLNNISSLNFNKNIALKSQKQSTNYSINSARSDDFKTVTYPNNYYLNQISFGAKKLSADELIAKIGEENFPSPEIIKRLKDLGDSTDFSLYDIHLDYYRDLLDCSTLEEVKKLYPEFIDVIDAEDVDLDMLDGRNIFKRIMQNKVKNISTKTIALDLLKNYYGRLHPVRQQPEYYNLSKESTKNILSLLNIKEFDKQYSQIIYYQNPEYLSRRSEQQITKWQEDDGTRREQYRKAASRLQTPESRAKNKASRQKIEYKIKRSIISKDMWQQDNGSRKKAASELASKLLHTEEVDSKRTKTLQSEDFRKFMSDLKTEFFANNPEYSEAQKLAWQRHPEITEKMSEIAEKYQGLGRIIAKRNSGEVLSEIEQTIWLTYLKECEEVMPGNKKIIGQEYHNILVEWGIIE